MTVLESTDHYIVGLAIDDIDSAATCLTAVNGYGWTKPIVCTLAATTTDRKYDVPLERTDEGMNHLQIRSQR
jgi:hypothetical protein